MLLPQDSSERAEYLREMARQAVPSFDFFLFSLISGVALGIALLLDAPALFVLAALAAPFMAPVLGIAVGTVSGTGSFIFQSLGSLSIGSLMVFLCGAAAGLAASFLPDSSFTQALMYSHFHWPYFFVLALGAGLTAYLTARFPHQKPLAASVAVAYGLYLPVGAAGFGLTANLPGLFPDGLGLFAVHLLWSAVAGILGLFVLRLRPLHASGYVLTVLYAVLGVAMLASLLPPAGPAGAAADPQPGGPALPAMTTTSEATGTPSPATPAAPSPSPSATTEPTRTPTRTLVPTNTPTLTLTPAATPVYARISASEGGGALVREEPNYSALVVQSVLNGTLVEVLPDFTNSEGVDWAHIRLPGGKEGWIVRTLLRTATPIPN
jgi:hypothetical protein